MGPGIDSFKFPFINSIWFAELRISKGINVEELLFEEKVVFIFNTQKHKIYALNEKWSFLYHM